MEAYFWLVVIVFVSFFVGVAVLSALEPTLWGGRCAGKYWCSDNQITSIRSRHGFGLQ